MLPRHVDKQWGLGEECLKNGERLIIDQIMINYQSRQGSQTGETNLYPLSTAGLRVQSIGDSTGLGLIVKATSTAAEAVANIQ